MEGLVFFRKPGANRNLDRTPLAKVKLEVFPLVATKPPNSNMGAIIQFSYACPVDSVETYAIIELPTADAGVLAAKLLDILSGV